MWHEAPPNQAAMVMTRSLFLSQDPIRTISLFHDTEIEMYSHNFSSNIWPHLSVKIWFGYIHHFLWVRQWPWWTNHLICIELLLIIGTCERKWWSSLCSRHLEILDGILMMHICVDPACLKMIKTTIIVNRTEVYDMFQMTHKQQFYYQPFYSNSQFLIWYPIIVSLIISFHSSFVFCSFRQGSVSERKRHRSLSGRNLTISNRCHCLYHAIPQYECRRGLQVSKPIHYWMLTFP